MPLLGLLALVRRFSGMPLQYDRLVVATLNLLSLTLLQSYRDLPLLRISPFLLQSVRFSRIFVMLLGIL
jgi:hypothetical protein